MRYVVNTDSPVWGSPAEARNDGDAEFRLGDVVEVRYSTPDPDGDVIATNLTRSHPDNRERYIAFKCLTLESEWNAPAVDALPKVEKTVREVITKTEVETFTLTISREDALALVALSGHIGGDAETTPRGSLSSDGKGIAAGLIEALGLGSWNGYKDAAAELGVEVRGSVMFEKIKEA